MDIIPPIQPLVKQSAGYVLYRVGTWVEEGELPRPHENPDIAVKFYLKAAYFGNCASMYSLGRMYKDGSGVPASIEEAIFWFMKSANGGNADAQAEMGDMYYNSSVVSARSGTRNPEELIRAYMWYNLAVAGGNSDAQRKRRLIEQRLKPEELSKAQELSIRWKPELE